MARLARVVVPGIPHHVTQRGNRRQETFFDEDGYDACLTVLRQWCGRCGVAVWTYCLMPNHVHLIAVPSLEDGLRLALGEAHRVVYVISTMPREVKLSPIRAEAIGADCLFTILDQLPEATGEWRDRLEHYVRLHQLVVRPILIRVGEYSHHLTELHHWDGNPIAPTPTEGFRAFFENERLWMIELSVPELFSANRRKVGEVLLRAQMTPTESRDFGNFVLARIPGYFVHCKKPDPVRPEFVFTPEGIQSHVQLYACESETF